eukprot:SAG31_NODE_5003_length_2807_cov_2.203471_2_plen_71_part_00
MGWFISINFYLIVETRKVLLGLSSRVRTIKIDEEAAGRARAPGAPICQWCLGWLERKDPDSGSVQMNISR